MEKKIVLASKNIGKILEFKSVLNPLGFKVLSRVSLNFTDDIEETGSTFEQNARIKAQACFDRLQLPTIADDSGLEVEALNGAPGVFSARYASQNGEFCTDEQNIKKILNEMANESNRAARMVCALCFINQFGKVFSVVEQCKGTLATVPQSGGGFGFDCIFKINGRLLSQLTVQDKNKISHRGKAINKLLNNLLQWW